MALLKDIRGERGEGITSEWTSVVPGTGSVEVIPAAAQGNTGYGFRYNAGSTPTSAVYTRVTTSGGFEYRFRFYCDVSNLTPAGLKYLVGLYASGSVLVTAVGLTATKQINVTSRNNAGGYDSVTSTDFDATEPCWIEVWVQRGSGTGGYFRVYRNTLASIWMQDTNFDSNNQPTITELWAGLHGGGSVTGYADIDEIVYRNDVTSIGPILNTPQWQLTHEDDTEGSQLFLGYSYVENANPNLVTSAAASLAGTGMGMKTIVGDGVSEYASALTNPSVDNVYRYRFYVKTVGLTFPSDGTRVYCLLAHTSIENTVTALGFERVSGDVRLFLWTTPGNIVTTPIDETVENFIEVLNVPALGQCKVYLNGSATPALSVSSISYQTIDHFFFGNALDGSSAGTIYLDELYWRDWNQEIGAWTPVVYNRNYESGNFDGDDNTVIGTGGSSTILTEAALNGTAFGLKSTRASGNDSHVLVAFPRIGKNTFRIRCFFDFTSAGGWADDDAWLGPIGMIQQTQSKTIIGTRWTKVAGQYQGQLRYQTSSGTVANSAVTWIAPAGENWLELEYTYGNPGAVRVWLNGVLMDEKTGVNTASVALPWRLRRGTFWVAGGAGSMYIDEVIIHGNGTPIGSDGLGGGFYVPPEPGVGGSPLRFF